MESLREQRGERDPTDQMHETLRGREPCVDLINGMLCVRWGPCSAGGAPPFLSWVRAAPSEVEPTCLPVLPAGEAVPLCWAVVGGSLKLE